MKIKINHLTPSFQLLHNNNSIKQKKQEQQDDTFSNLLQEEIKKIKGEQYGKI